MKIGLAVLVLAVSANPAFSSGWEYFSENNPFTGKEDQWAALVASGPTISPDGYPYGPMRLFVACLEGNFDVSVEVGTYVGSGKAAVRYRFDAAETIVERWAISNDGSAVFVPRSYRDFKAGLEASSDLAFEIADFRGVVFRAIFNDLEKNREVVEGVRIACD